MIDSRRSHNYSLALFSQGSIKKINEDVYRDLAAVSLAISGNKRLFNFIYNPAVSFNEKKDLLKKVFKVNPLTLHFLFILTKNKALELLNDITGKYKEFMDNLKNIEPVKITSAYELNKENRGAIKKKLDAALKKDTACTFDVDPCLIAGFTVQYADNLLDGSLKNQLKEIKEKLSVL